jgi:DNA invertase Pin-like site-specific DNA recombinase
MVKDLDQHRARVRAGLAAAKARGIRLGRPRREFTDEQWRTVDRILSQGGGIHDAARAIAVPPKTLRDHLRRIREGLQHVGKNA